MNYAQTKVAEIVKAAAAQADSQQTQENVKAGDQVIDRIERLNTQANERCRVQEQTQGHVQ